MFAKGKHCHFEHHVCLDTYYNTAKMCYRKVQLTGDEVTGNQVTKLFTERCGNFSISHKSQIWKTN